MFGSILTSRQTSELHKAIVQYLEPLLENDRSALDTVSRVLDVSPASGAADDGIIPRYLEKKWSTVLRLQKKILDLENEVNSYKVLIEAGAGNLSGSSGAGGDFSGKNRLNWLPSASTIQLPTLSTQTVNSVAVHPLLPVVAAGCSDGSLLAWNLAAEDHVGGQKQIAAHTRGINRVRWSVLPIDLTRVNSEQYVLASCSLDLTIKIWEGDTLKHVRTLTGHDHTVSGVAFSPEDSKILYSVSRDKSVKIWDLYTGYCIRSFVGHSDWVRDLDVVLVNNSLGLETMRRSTLGEFVLTCSNDQSVRLSHALLGVGLALLLGHTHVVEAVRFLPMRSNKYVDKYILENMDRYTSYLLDAIVNNTLYADSLGFKYCVSAGRDNVMKLWLLPPPVLTPNRAPLPSSHNSSQGWHIADLLGHQSWIRAIEVHPNGRYLLTASDDKTIRVWDLKSLPGLGKQTCVRVLQAHDGFVNSINLASIPQPKKKFLTAEDAEKWLESNMRCLLASAGTDNTVSIWS
ncbi:hypothetical protein PUMCH_003910 [Australozyma saopauloensis]|uniref:Nuclear distribution protein PAC1 n=1 Tax=Australozyma saopauloensis TaxID=291208 RepID=A0AAX4HD38_9ASCO|nr:hypothetical protein PUMCH_003910 [[Candida] saopauloensis]